MCLISPLLQLGVPAHKAIFNFFSDNKAIFIFKMAIFNLNSSKLTNYAEPSSNPSRNLLTWQSADLTDRFLGRPLLAVVDLPFTATSSMLYGWDGKSVTVISMYIRVVPFQSMVRQLPLKNKNPEINAHVFHLLADKHFIYFQFDINDKTSLCDRIVLT